jgi:hypothetical protein
VPGLGDALGAPVAVAPDVGEGREQRGRDQEVVLGSVQFDDGVAHERARDGDGVVEASTVICMLGRVEDSLVTTLPRNRPSGAMPFVGPSYHSRRTTPALA